MVNSHRLKFLAAIKTHAVNQGALNSSLLNFAEIFVIMFTFLHLFPLLACIHLIFAFEFLNYLINNCRRIRSRKVILSPTVPYPSHSKFEEDTQNSVRCIACIA